MPNTPQNIQRFNDIILFDGVCNLCSAFLNFVYKFDAHAVFTFAWIQSDEGGEILEWLGMPTHDYKTIIYVHDGNAYFKSTAFLKIVKHLQFPWPLFQIGYVLPRFMRDWIYDVVATYRYKIFGKKDSCLLPTGELKSRFLQL